MKVFGLMVVSALVLPPVLVSQLQEHLKVVPLKKSAIEKPKCDPSAPSGDRTRAVARAQCYVDQLEEERQKNPQDGDLLLLAGTVRLATAEKFQNGDLSGSEADVVFTTKLSEIISEDQRRKVARANAISNMAAASRSNYSMGFTCSTIGYMTHCN